MATDSKGVKKPSLLTKWFGDFDKWDAVTMLLGFGGLAGGLMNSHDDKNPPPLAPDQEDEGNMALLLNIFYEGGDARQLIRADQLKGVHDALVTIHKDYAHQYRNFFFSVRGTKPEEIAKNLLGLLKALLKIPSLTDGLRSKLINESSNFAITTARILCYEIQQEIDKLNPLAGGEEKASQEAFVIIAQRMIADKRLPGTVIADTEVSISGYADQFNKFLQNDIRKRAELRTAEQTRKPLSKITLAVIGIIVLFFFVQISTMLFTPNQKQYTPNPLDKVTQKVSVQVEELYPTKPQQGE